MLFFLNWELFSPLDHPFEVTNGNEVIEIFIHDIDGCRPVGRFTVPLVQAGQSLSRLNVRLLYQKDQCSKPLKHILVQIRILRGIEHRLIYTGDVILQAPYYIDGNVRYIPIRRVWHRQDYYAAARKTAFAI
jgi:hypothetical protein